MSDYPFKPLGIWHGKWLMKPEEFVRERQIGEITVTLPEPPKDITKILNYDKPIKQQKWVKSEQPDFKRISIEDQKAFLRQELDRRDNGVFIYIHGGIEYLTGVHYWMLQNWIIDGRPMKFIDAQRDNFYFWKYCVEDDQCFGEAFFTNRRFGKALDINTDIPTPDGWKKMKDIQEGDYVFGSDGKPTKVTYTSPIQYNRDCFKVVFSDKSEIIADKDHLWLAYDKIARSVLNHHKWIAHKRLVTTGQMRNKLKIGKKPESNWSITTCKPVEYSEKNLKIPPYILGIWLGDGSSHYTKLTNIDRDIIDKWVDYGKSVGLSLKMDEDITYMLTTGKKGGDVKKRKENKLLKSLQEYNLIANKHIPRIYLESSVEDRRELLKGLMDTDGCVCGDSPTFEYCSKSKTLIKDVKELIESLGYKATLTEKVNKKYSKTYYYIRFGSYRGEDVFSLGRKINSCKKTRKGGWRVNHRYIVDIIPVESIPVKCIQVDNEDHTYLCGRSFIPTHNTEIGMGIVYEYVSKTPSSHGGMQSKTNGDAAKIFRKLIQRWKRLPSYWRPVHSGEKLPKKSLNFEEPSTKTTKGEQQYKNVLDSFIDYMPSVEEAYDGDKMQIYYDDEFGKLTEGNAYSRWDIVKECLAIGNRIIGKSIHTTTVEELQKKGGQAALDIWNDSNPNEKGADGRTKSGLYRYFNPAYYGLEGFVDEYGFTNTEEAYNYLLKKRDGLKGERLAREQRKYPITPYEAFMSINSESVFPVHRIDEQYIYNETLKLESGLIRVGNLIWTDDSKNKVEFVDDPNGKWKIWWMPSPEDRNAYELNKNGKAPKNIFRGGIGVDPFDHDKVVYGQGSNGAIYVFRKYDPSEPLKSNCYVAEYVYRPAMAQIFHDDVAKTCVFYGMKALIENNKPGCIQYMENNGFKNYVERTQQGEFSKSNSRNWISGIATTGDGAREAIINGLVLYMHHYVGQITAQTQMEKMGMSEENIIHGLMGVCPFQWLLTDWKNFDVTNWTPSDATVASGLALMMANRTKIVEVQNDGTVLTSIFPLYDVSGNISKRR